MFFDVVLQTRSKYFAGGRIYLGLSNRINGAIMRMHKSYRISACASVYLTEIYFIMAVFKQINFSRLMIWYLCRRCANWILYTWSNIINWNQKLPSRSGNSKCNLAKRAWVAYWPYSEQGHTFAKNKYQLSAITYWECWCNWLTQDQADKIISVVIK